MPQHFDFIIVGQGIAGTLLTHFLTLAQKNILVIDAYNPNASSNVAAGIIHPVTGRRLVKTWMYETAFSSATKTYKAIAEQFNTEFFIHKPILELFDSIKTRNDWSVKSADASISHLVGEMLPAHFNKTIEAPFGGILLNSGGFLLIKKLIETYRNFLAENNMLLNEHFDINLLQHHEKTVSYKSISADKIIFCEGWHAAANPFFKPLPFQPAKGEVLVVKCEALTSDYIINKSNYILPLGNSYFKIGATFDWNNLNTNPTAEAREHLSKQFSSIVNAPFTIEDHFAAVRPTVKERKPFIGMHPKYNNIGIFNGLGTKGVLLAPWLAAMMCDLLIKEQPLIKEVQIGKWYKT